MITEVPLQLLLGLQSATNPIVVDVEERPLLEKRAKTDIFNPLTVLEEHMASRTYIVGEKITLADVSLFAAYSTVLQLGAVQTSSVPSLVRWFMTVGNHPKVKSVVDAYLSLAVNVVRFPSHVVMLI